MIDPIVGSEQPPSNRVPIRHAADYLRQYRAVHFGVDTMGYFSLGGSPNDTEYESCKEIHSQAREWARANIQGCMSGAKIPVWRANDQGRLEPCDGRWAAKQLEEGTAEADNLYFASADWEQLVPVLTSPESRATIDQMREGKGEARALKVPKRTNRQEQALADDPWMTLAQAVRWAGWLDQPEPEHGSVSFDDGSWVDNGDLEEQDRLVYLEGVEKVRKALACGQLEAWAQTGGDELIQLPKARWSNHVVGTIVSWTEFYHPYDRIIVEEARVRAIWLPLDAQEGPPPNRQLNHDDIIGQATVMRSAQPRISKGSAAASIVADLPPNPRTGKPRDTRNIERIIAHLWGGGDSKNPLQKPLSPDSTRVEPVLIGSPPRKGIQSQRGGEAL